MPARLPGSGMRDDRIAGRRPTGFADWDWSLSRTVARARPSASALQVGRPSDTVARGRCRPHVPAHREAAACERRRRLRTRVSSRAGSRSRSPFSRSCSSWRWRCPRSAATRASTRRARGRATSSRPADEAVPAGRRAARRRSACRCRSSRAGSTAIGYHRLPTARSRLQPIGPPGERGRCCRASRHRLFGGGGGLRAGTSSAAGPPTSALDVGAPAGTDVYAPVDGTVVGVTPYVVDGHAVRRRASTSSR